MILILSNKDDQLTDVVGKELEDRKIKFVRFDTETYPRSFTASVAFDRDLMTGRLCNGTVNTDDVSAIWYWRPKESDFSEIFSSDDVEFAQKECEHFIRGLYHCLEDRYWINPLLSLHRAKFKPYQLMVARKLGLQVPKTLLTNDPDEAALFLDQCGGRCVYKAFESHFRAGPQPGEMRSIYTTIITRQRFLEKRAQISLTPCTFQEYVEKKVELRVTVFGEQLFAMQIDSQRSQIAMHDWRHYDFDPSLYSQTVLPQEIEAKLLALMSHLGLVIGCIDMIKTPDDRYVFLEINPNGQWAWLEGFCGLPMIRSFVDLLTKRTAR